MYILTWREKIWHETITEIYKKEFVDLFVGKSFIMTTSEGYSGEIFRKNHHFWHNHHIRKNYFSGFFFSSILGKIIIRKARGEKRKKKDLCSRPQCAPRSGSRRSATLLRRSGSKRWRRSTSRLLLMRARSVGNTAWILFFVLNHVFFDVSFEPF